MFLWMKKGERFKARLVPPAELDHKIGVLMRKIDELNDALTKATQAVNDAADRVTNIPPPAQTGTSDAELEPVIAGVSALADKAATIAPGVVVPPRVTSAPGQ